MLNTKNLLLLLFCTFSSFGLAGQTAKEKIRTPAQPAIMLRQHGQDGVHTYRIPGLAVTNKGTLLAIYDVRRDLSRDLQGDIDVGVSRSTDGGKTWEPMRIAMDRGKWGGLPEKFNGISDACILVDKKSDNIFIASLWMYGVLDDNGKWITGLTDTSTVWNHQWRQKGSQPGFDVKETSQFVITKSTNDGKSWSKLTNLTTLCKQKDWWLWAPAPGNGITLEDGTLVFPTQGRDKDGTSFSNITWSKDEGKTWKTSQPAAYNTTECAVVQLSDGSIMLNMRDNRNRNDSTASNGRNIAVTSDLGTTWKQHPTSRGTLIEPTCMASLYKHTYTENGTKKSILLFTNPNTKTGRHHMTLKVSFDDGATWPEENWILLDEGKSRGYSCITSIDEQNIGILYEGSKADMMFQRIGLDEILNKPVSANTGKILPDNDSLFHKNMEGYACLRIPALVQAKSGRILAFAEARRKSCSDTGNIDLVLKYSDDGGKTWSSLITVWDDGDNVCGNPAPVVDRTTGRIILASTWNRGSDHEKDIILGTSKDSRHPYILYSDDEGLTWSTPANISADAKKENWAWYATGPCHAIQLQSKKYKNRIVIPCNFITRKDKVFHSHVIYSDDKGSSWKLGGVAPQPGGNESSVVELKNGDLMLNMRNYSREQGKCRAYSISKDGGASWSDVQFTPELEESICQGNILNYSPKGKLTNTLLFSNPASDSKRINMTIKVSKDDGKSWTKEIPVYRQFSAYSDMLVLKNGDVAILYEHGETTPYDKIGFRIYSSDEFK